MEFFLMGCFLLANPVYIIHHKYKLQQSLNTAAMMIKNDDYMFTKLKFCMTVVQLICGHIIQFLISVL